MAEPEEGGGGGCDYILNACLSLLELDSELSPQKVCLVEGYDLTC